MVDFQACAAATAAALGEPSSNSPHPQATNKLPEPALSMPQYQQQHISEKVVGVGGSGGVPVEEDEERGGGGGGGSSSLDGGVRSSGGGGAELFGGARQALKRSRLAVEDDELSIPPMDLSGPNDNAPAFCQHPYQQHRQDDNPVVEATNNVVDTHLMHSHSQQQQQQQQQFSAEQNGHHAIASAHVESLHYGSGDAHMMFDGGSHRHPHGGLWNPQIRGQMPGQGAAVFQGLSVSEVIVELEREHKKNAELQRQLSILEARLGSGSNVHRHGAPVQNGEKKSKKHQRSVDRTTGDDENEGSRKVSGQQNQSSAIKEKEEAVVVHVTIPLEDPIQTDSRDNGVTWMTRKEVTPPDLEKLSKDIISDREDTGDSDDDEEEQDEDDLEDDEDDEGGSAKKKRKSEGEQQQVWNAVDAGVDAEKGVLDLTEDGEKTLPGASGERGHIQNGIDGKEKRRTSRKERRKGKQGEKALFKRRGFGGEMMSVRGLGIMSYKKTPKTAFCPKEVKRIMDSGVLALKNAQSHTIRKIIVFSSLGIRLGCEDLYELDFSHFSVVQRGEPYKSPKDPGEHVLYNQSGVRTKIFYPNRQNPILCPVHILDEEKAMRPADPSCPTCLFLCIKYGGRTRNLPQNEYVRQRMGRNKLKSFGPLMCQMALLVHIRMGSFFFKALGITLLFMAGIPDDLVRKETKYQNLDLLRKYCRPDEDTQGEQLFHPYPTFLPPATMVASPLTYKTAVAAKGTSKKGSPPLLSKSPFTSPIHAALGNTVSTCHVFLRHTASIFSSSPFNASRASHIASASASRHPSPLGLPPPPPFAMYPPYHLPMHQGGCVPMPWAPVNSYPPGPYTPPPLAFQPFRSHSSQFLPPFYGPPYGFPLYGQQSTMKKKKEAEESGELDSDSDSGSGGAGKKASEKGKKEVLELANPSTN